MKKLFAVLLVFSLLVVPSLVSASMLWRISFSGVSTWHYGNTQEWVVGTGDGGLETYTPPEPEIIIPDWS